MIPQRQEGIQLDLWVCIHGFNQSQAENVIWSVGLGLQGICTHTFSG